MHPEDRDAAVNEWRRCVATRTPFDAEYRLRHVSGEWRWTRARAAPLLDAAGRVRGWVGMNADFTERKLAELEQSEANRRKDEFLAMLGHELRNPLAPLRNAMALFDRLLPNDPELRRIRDMAERQVRHLIRLVDELLDVARISSGRMELKLARVNLRSIVEAAVANIEPAAKEHGHALSVEIGPEPLEVDGDEVRLAQIVANLLDNAVKYTPDGGRISVAAARQGRFAKLSVKDNGVGLAPEQLSSVFSVFFRVEPASQTQRGGLGLGLTLVRRLAELHGGSAEGRSEGIGKGAEFIVRLPLAPAKVEEKAKVEPPAPAAAPRSILLVDDNVDVVKSLKMLLEMEGHKIGVAYDGRSALEAAAKDAPEVVIMDIGLPDMDGYELARRLRDLEATSKALLIAATGFGQRNDRDRSAKAGIDHHFVKPLDLDALEALLRTAPAGRACHPSPRSKKEGDQ